jgi:hypothetical protein
VSPRWFNRRTYRIVASGRSALTFNAAMSASSASTTIRSAFLLTLSPTVNCHDIFGFLKARLGYERMLTGIDQTLHASLVFFCAWVLSRRSALSAHAYICTNMCDGRSTAEVLATLYSGQRPADIARYHFLLQL